MDGKVGAPPGQVLPQDLLKPTRMSPTLSRATDPIQRQTPSGAYVPCWNTVRSAGVWSRKRPVISIQRTPFWPAEAVTSKLTNQCCAGAGIGGVAVAFAEA